MFLIVKSFEIKNYLLFIILTAMKAIIAMMRTTINIPVPIPALKMPSTTEQLLNVVKVKNRIIEHNQKFDFIMSEFKSEFLLFILRG